MLIAVYFLAVGLLPIAPQARHKRAMLDLLTDPNAWAALVTLTALEIVLGIDNVVFISVLVSRCSPRAAPSARGRSGCRWRLSSASSLLFGADLR